MPLGYYNLAVSRSVSFGVVEPYIYVHQAENTSKSIKSPPTFPGCSNGKLTRSHSTDDAAHRNGTILSDSTNRSSMTFDRSVSFASDFAVAGLESFAEEGDDDMHDAETTIVHNTNQSHERGTTDERMQPEPIQEALEESDIFRASVRSIYRYEPPIVSDSACHEDDSDSDIQDLTHRAHTNTSDDDEATSDMDCISLFSLKRANPIYESDDESWSSQDERASKRSRSDDFIFAESSPAYAYDDLVETNQSGVEVVFNPPSCSIASQARSSTSTASAHPKSTVASSLLTSTDDKWSQQVEQETNEEQDQSRSTMDLSFSNSFDIVDEVKGFVIPTPLDSRQSSALATPE